MISVRESSSPSPEKVSFLDLPSSGQSRAGLGYRAGVGRNDKQPAGGTGKLAEPNLASLRPG